MSNKFTEEQEDAISNVALSVFTTATVDDNWVSQLKLYRKIKLDDSETGAMFLSGLAVLRYITMDKFADLTDDESILKNFTKKFDDDLVSYMYMTSGSYDGGSDSKRKKFKKEVLRVIDNTQEDIESEIENSERTVIDCYAILLMQTPSKLPEDAAVLFAEHKIQLFEEDIPSKLMDVLL